MKNYGYLIVDYVENLYICTKFLIMNRIRKTWKENGTPFYFTFNDGHQRHFIDSFTCASYDKILVEDCGLTALDTLVDIRCVLRALAQVDDTMVKSSVLDALSLVFSNLQYIVSLNKK